MRFHIMNNSIKICKNTIPPRWVQVNYFIYALKAIKPQDDAVAGGRNRIHRDYADTILYGRVLNLATSSSAFHSADRVECLGFLNYDYGTGL